jgi:hypothetical protein
LANSVIHSNAFTPLLTLLDIHLDTPTIPLHVFHHPSQLPSPSLVVLWAFTIFHYHFSSSFINHHHPL